MVILRSLLAAWFLAMSFGIAMQAWRVRRLGLLFGALAYGAAGLSSFAARSWWPLLLGFAVAWALRRVDADPPTDLRFDLRMLEREHALDPLRILEYAEKWLAVDSQVALIQSDFVQEAWSGGLRKPVSIPDTAHWTSATSVAAWKAMLAADLNRISSLTKPAPLSYLDSIDEISRPTLVVAGEVAFSFDLPAVPSSYASVEAKISDRTRREEFAKAYVADAVLAARLRVLAWAF